jgi:WD40 repeat protein
MYHKETVEEYPLQVYASALVFSPADSLIRQLFQHEEQKGVAIKPDISNGWRDCLQTLESHTGYIRSVAFSHDSARLASVSGDSTLKIWDAHSGACLQTLKGHSDDISSVAFSHDSARLASASFDRTVKIWDAHSGACLQTLEGHTDNLSTVVFSHDSARLASASYNNTVKIWDAHSGACLQTLEEQSTSDLPFILATPPCNEDVDESQQSLRHDYSIRVDSTWILIDSQNMLWLTPEYQPSCATMSHKSVGVGTGHGTVWIGRVK